MSGGIERIGVVGAGIMGCGIAQVCAANSLRVVLRDVLPALVESGIAAIGGALEQLVARQKLAAAERDAILARIAGSTTLDPLAEVDFCIEAATESAELKLRLFRETLRAVRWRDEGHCQLLEAAASRSADHPMSPVPRCYPLATLGVQPGAAPSHCTAPREPPPPSRSRPPVRS